MMFLLVASNIDSVYNYILKSLKLNPKTTTYKVDTIGINLYQFSIRTTDKKQNLSKIAESLKKLDFELRDSLYFGKILSNEVKDLKLSSNKDTIFISFTIKIIPPALVFKEEKILNFLLNTTKK
jgi:diphthamide synthase (EF-2-diphthine--ammonia ligase)